MLKIILEYVLGFAIILILITQIIIPAFFKDMPLFWIFKKIKLQEPEGRIGSLEELDTEATINVEALNKTKEKVQSAEETLNKIKNKTK